LTSRLTISAVPIDDLTVALCGYRIQLICTKSYRTASPNSWPVFLQRINIACYAECCTSYSKSVSVCPSHAGSLALCQNDSSYDHAAFTVGLHPQIQKGT